jgi:hypothetical protein
MADEICIRCKGPTREVQTPFVREYEGQRFQVMLRAVQCLDKSCPWHEEWLSSGPDMENASRRIGAKLARARLTSGPAFRFMWVAMYDEHKVEIEELVRRWGKPLQEVRDILKGRAPGEVPPDLLRWARSLYLSPEELDDAP